MGFGKMHDLIKNYTEINNTIIIESPFIETTRKGSFIEELYLAVTLNEFIVAKKVNWNIPQPCGIYEYLELKCVCPLQLVKLSVFKKTRRLVMKVNFGNKNVRYFELGNINNEKMFWDLWCNIIIEFNKQSKKWPHTKNISKKMSDNYEKIFSAFGKENRWTDKYLYLGDKRYIEDQHRPMPIPGLGGNDEIKMFYLKPTISNVCKQENNLQIQDNSMWDFNVYTYTGRPTIDVAYVSVVNNVRK